MIFWPRRHRQEVLAAVVLLARRGESLPDGLRELGREDPDLRRLSAGLGARLERGEALAAALVAERLLTAREAATLGADPAGALERLTRRWVVDRSGAALLRWYPLWLAAWWMLPGLGLAAVVEGVSGQHFPLTELWGQGWLTPDLAVMAALALGFWALVSWALQHRWLQPLAFLLMPGAHHALLARQLLDQAAAGAVPASWWGERRLWHWTYGTRTTPAADPLAALVADRLLILAADGRPDWAQSHQHADEVVRSRLAPARAVLVFGLVLAALAGVADFLKLNQLMCLFDFRIMQVTGHSLLMMAGLLAGIIALQIPVALGRWLLVGWHWNPAWPRVAGQLAAALERREDPLIALGGCHLLVPAGLRGRLDAACLELATGNGGSLMTVLGRAGIVTPPQRQAALAAEQAGSEALIAWLHQEAATTRAGGGVLAQLQVQILFCLFITTYLTIAVLPKFLHMFQAMGLRENAPWSLLMIMELCSSWWPYLLLGGLVAAGLVSHRRGWWPGQREVRRLHRGDLLVRGLAAGRTEADLAGILAWTWRSPPAGLLTAGPRGDWSRLLALAGWAGSTPATLAEQVDRDRLRQGRSLARSVALGLVLVPFLTAVPVALTLHSVFASIAAINRHSLDLAQQNPGGTGRYLGAVIDGPDPVMVVPFFRQPFPLAPPRPGAVP